MNFLLKLAGVGLLVTGLLLAIRPDFFGKFSTSLNAYQMIEKRVKWGVLIGMGGFMIVYTNWVSWNLLASALLLSITLGIILARLIGFALDGFFTKQSYWLLIEIVALVIFWLLYWKQRN
ncbi:DUF4345 family protein [Spirosoma sp. KNUC1025]|uniref:DUF4345 family protein n=1 Tax=Spirosoma sp. KNUC1025 TaxID=2894082 RepID=UPI001E63206B|nr:DUF4345 family protein [Spirosoma sp. KNUC1025]UFH57796.1 hypothetical protein LN737_32780 [Spirosoma sp. KNUC1025]